MVVQFLDFPAGNVGENEIKGKFIFMENGKPVEIPVETSYAVVAKPNSAVISADKMNVVYRGVQIPLQFLYLVLLIML